MWGVSIVVRRGGSGILDVWTSRFDWAIQYQCCYWCDNARWGYLYCLASFLCFYHTVYLSFGFTGRHSGQSKAGPSLGEEEVHEKSLLPTNFQFNAPLLLAPSDRPCLTRWEENFAFDDYSSFLFIMYVLISIFQRTIQILTRYSCFKSTYMYSHF